ncbi:MAG TPA: hypothetical protein VGL92_14465, partial [Acidimicrobiia bacterium]
RRSACLLVALAVLLPLMVVSAGPAGATVDKGGAYVPAARAEDPGANESGKDKADKKNQKEELCPQDKWVIGLPIEGLACVLLLPKPPAEGEGKGGGGGGFGGLFQ